ncbi:MAG: hypothetical protein KAI55_03110 [Candidatus Aenigmarchaeota archaeon]|nr:hypothetical protein [Candidatus Aenigmarchaeota archaeon]
MDKEAKKEIEKIDSNAKKEERNLDKVITVAGELKKQRRHLSDVEKKIIESHLENDSDVREKLLNARKNIKKVTHKVENIVGGGVEELSEKQKHLVSGASKQRRQNFSGNNKRTYTHIKESKKETEIRETNVSFFVKLYDDEDKPLDGMEIKYKIDNKDTNISNETSHGGLSVVIFSRKEGVEIYNIQAIFRGDDKYESCVYDEEWDLSKRLQLKYKNPPTDKRTRGWRPNKEEEEKAVYSLISNALYSKKDTERVKAISELKKIKNKNSIIYNLKKHENEIRDEKKFGRYGGMINYLENELGLNHLDNVRTVDNLPDAMMNKREEIMARLKEIEAEVKQTVKEISKFEKQ